MSQRSVVCSCTFLSSGILVYDYLNLHIKELNVDKWRVHFFLSGLVNTEHRTQPTTEYTQLEYHLFCFFKLKQINMKLDQTTGFQKKKCREKERAVGESDCGKEKMENENIKES